MMNRIVLAIAAAAALAGCSPRPVNELSFAELESAAHECDTSGRTATDDRCKQVQLVYGTRLQKRAEEARVARVQARAASMATAGSAPSF